MVRMHVEVSKHVEVRKTFIHVEKQVARKKLSLYTLDWTVFNVHSRNSVAGRVLQTLMGKGRC